MRFKRIRIDFDLVPNCRIFYTHKEGAWFRIKFEQDLQYNNIL